MVDLDPAGFTVQEGLASGLTRAQLRGIHAPFHGTRAPIHPRTIIELARALQPVLRPGDRFSHTTAAALHRMRMPRRFVEVLHVTSTTRRAMERPRVVGHRSSEVATVLVHGMLASTPIQTWLECASVLELDDLVIMGDGLIRRQRPLSTLDELRAAVQGRLRTRGYRTLCAALVLLRANTDSARETELRLLLTRSGLPEPEVNGEIHNSFGALLAHGDLVYREQKVLIEYEGAGHLEARQFAIDIDRLDLIMAEGWRVIRVDKYLFADPQRLLNKVRDALSRPR